MMIIMDDHNIMEGPVGPWQALGNRSDNPSGPSPFGLPGGIFLIFANHSKLILTLDHIIQMQICHIVFSQPFSGHSAPDVINLQCLQVKKKITGRRKHV